MAQSITLSSAGTATLVLNPVSKSTTVIMTGTPSSLSVAQIEVSLDDPTIVGGPSLTWALLSSASAMVGSSTVGLSVIYTVLSPIGAVRINSSTVTASSAVFTLKALQSISA